MNIVKVKSATDDTATGPIHTSRDGETTACGQSTGNGFWEFSKPNNDLVTCARCRNLMVVLA
jgi:hypothetical protein